MKHAFLACAALVLVAASPAEETRHTVKDGETLNGIANRAGVPASAIAKANGLKQPYTVRVGQVLAIPRDAARATSHVVRDGETLNGIANRAGVSPAALAQANGLEPPYPVRVGQKLAIPRGGRAGEKVAPPAIRPSGDERANSLTDDTGSETYVVRPGETLNGIANRAGVPKAAIVEANALSEPYVVKAGQKLRIPRQRMHIVAEGETGFGISFKYGVPYSAILTANDLPEDAMLKTGQKLMIPALIKPRDTDKSQTSAPDAKDNASMGFHWPLTGAILAPYDPDAPGGGHRGIDIEASVGKKVEAAKAGRVVFAGDEPVRYGKMVVLRHSGDWYSAYGNLSSISVRKGEIVALGEVIGHAGSTGKARQPQLHFELGHANRPVDPLTRLERIDP